jgi:drug/metabolite transporter (DMT)-like permease
MNRRPHLKGDILLLITAMIWGSAFVAQKAGMDHIGPFMYTGIRFAIGALFLTPIMLLLSRYRPYVIKKQEDEGSPFKVPSLPVAGILAGTLLFGGTALQQVGIIYTTAGKAGFITGLYVVIVPLLGLIWGLRPGKSVWAGAILAVAGLYLLTVGEDLTLGRGDALVIMCAFMYALHVLVIGWIAPRLDVLKLAIMQFWVCSGLGLAVGLVLEELTWTALRGAAIPILYGGLLSVGIGFTLQVVAQQRAKPANAAVIMSLETVFAVLAGVLILGEGLPFRGWAGCALMLTGMLAAQLEKRS